MKKNMRYVTLIISQLDAPMVQRAKQWLEGCFFWYPALAGLLSAFWPATSSSIISTTQQINRREVRYLLRESNWMVNLLGIAFMMGALAQKIQEANSLQFMVGTIIGYLSIIVDFEDEP